MRQHTIIGLTMTLTLAACGDLEVRSVPATEAVPAALEGEWVGQWQSSRNASSGPITIRIQEFDLQPVVALTINNPCLQPQDYELVLLGSAIALQADGATVFEANLLGPATLEGGYECAADDGSWTATRVRELPSPLDLSGTWTGTMSVPGVFQEALVLTLDQSVRNGALAVDGFADLPGALPVPVELTGYVRFRDDDFELVLQSIGSFEPVFVMSGVGSREPLEVPVGLLELFGPPGQPFSQGLFEIVRAPE